MSTDLLQFSKGGGCGCKLEPGKLAQLLRNIETVHSESLLVGFGTSDDAAVYDLKNGNSIVQTVDFFLPVVSDPFDFGKISAANAISDVYVMGAKPVMALAILAWPENLPYEEANQVMKGAAEICRQAGIPIAGGHSINASEPMFGLTVTGLLENQYLKRNNTAESGNFIQLTKPIGLGLLANSHKLKKLNEAHYKVLVDTASTLNACGLELSANEHVTAMTDVTGFGLLGHLKEMLAKGLGAELDLNNIPLLEGALEVANQMIYPNITTNNYNFVKDICDGLDGMEFLWLCDPQTGGGVLFTSREPVPGYPVIGKVNGTGRITMVR